MESLSPSSKKVCKRSVAPISSKIRPSIQQSFGTATACSSPVEDDESCNVVEDEAGCDGEDEESCDGLKLIGEDMRIDGNSNCC